jgi:hypothetical protein
MMNSVNGSHAAVSNLRNDAIRSSKGVTFFDRNIGFGSLKLVLQFTTFAIGCLWYLLPFPPTAFILRLFHYI